MSNLNNNNLSLTSNNITDNTSHNNMSNLNNNNLSLTSNNNTTSDISKSQINNVILSDTSPNMINNISSDKLSEFNNIFKGGSMKDPDSDLFSSSSSTSDEIESMQHDHDIYHIGEINNNSDDYDFSKETTDYLIDNNNSNIISSFSGYSLNGINSDSDNDTDNDKLTYSLSSLNFNKNNFDTENNSDSYNINFENSDSEVSTFNTSDIDVVSVNSGKRFL